MLLKVCESSTNKWKIIDWNSFFFLTFDVKNPYNMDVDEYPAMNSSIDGDSSAQR